MSIYVLWCSGDLVAAHTIQIEAVVPLEGSNFPYFMLHLHLDLCANHIWTQTSTRFQFILTALCNLLAEFNFTSARIVKQFHATSGSHIDATLKFMS